METFDNPRKYEERTGSSVDAGNLKDLATELGFEVECENFSFEAISFMPIDSLLPRLLLLILDIRSPQSHFPRSNRSDRRIREES